MTIRAEAAPTGSMIDIEERWGAHNYHPLPVVVARAEGPWVYDIEGVRYLDCLSAYSAVNQGHCHPRILGALRRQAERVTLTSRAYRNDQLPLFCRELAELCGLEMVLPMNSGAEAVETSIKAARRWGYMRKGIPPDRAEIVVCENNFHGRTTTIVGFSSDPGSREGFGPFTPGFRTVPFGDADALAAAITPFTCAFLVEPIQCEAGILMPPAGYLSEAAAICRDRGVLLVADEIQTGLGRTGRLFACEHEGVRPDVYVLGKALSGGFYPVSAVVAPARRARCLRPRKPRLDLRRQPAGLRRGPRGAARDARRAAGGAVPGAGSLVPRRAGPHRASPKSSRSEGSGCWPESSCAARPGPIASACRVWGCSARRPMIS